jgi:putative colanic acid biosynthesis glycosyltransferase WcaI
MNILYVSQYFPPEMGAPAARVSELSRHWVRSGHQVTVLTGFPNHPSGVVPLAYRAKLKRAVYREQIDGINVVRTWLLPLPNRKTYERILNYGSFCLSSCITGTFISRPDVIIATSPQLLVGLTGWWLGRAKRVPFILEVRDLWPESLSAVGVGNDGSTLVRFLGKLAKFLYEASNHVVVVTPAFREQLIQNWNVDPAKISVVENGVETSLFSSNRKIPSSEHEQFKGRFVVSYIGTLGNASGLEVALKAAKQLQHVLPKVLFLFVGEGAEKEQLVSLAHREGLGNVVFLPQQPRERIPSLIQLSDVCLVLLKKAAVFKTVIPTKMLEFMACGRPVILGVDGQAREILEAANGGLFIEPEDVTALVQAIKHLYEDAECRRVLGANGRRYIVEHLSRERLAWFYSRILEQLVPGKTLNAYT